MNDLDQFTTLFLASIHDYSLKKLTLGKSVKSELKNIYITPHEKINDAITALYRYETRDEVKHISNSEIEDWIRALLLDTFLSAHLFQENIEYELKFNKKRIPKLFSKKNQNIQKSTISKSKKLLITPPNENVYLKQLGVLGEHGQVLKNKGDKYKQVGKYIEIIDGLIAKSSFKTNALKVVDMGSGSGYLTFALYDYLKNFSDYNPSVTGIELRKEMVEKCNNIVRDTGYDALSFKQGLIEDYDGDADIVIVLHACDTATDDALMKAINANAPLIICAPCCHKEIRKQLDSSNTINKVLKYNIYQERFSEMLTDTLRAMILECLGYKVNVFEFISSEHAGKNSMITAIKHQATPMKSSRGEVLQLMNEFGIKRQRLFDLLDEFKRWD